MPRPVGEPSANEEDLAGKSFVGPAGRLLDRALAEAGIPREEAHAMGTVHPSAILRSPTDAERRAATARFVDDLRVAAAAVRAP